MLTQILRKMSMNYPKYFYLSDKTGHRRATLLSSSTVGKDSAISIPDIFEAAKIPVTFDVIENFDFSNPVHCETLRKNRYLLLHSSGVDKPETGIPQINKYLNLHTSCVKILNPGHLNSPNQNPAIEIISECVQSDPSTEEVEIAPRTVRSLSRVSLEDMKKVARYAFQQALSNRLRRIIVVHNFAAGKLEEDTFTEAMKEVRSEYPMIEYLGVSIEECMAQMARDYKSLNLMVMTSGSTRTVSRTRESISPRDAIGINIAVGDDQILYNQKHLPRGLTIGNEVFDPTSLLLGSCCMLKSMQMYRYSDMLLLALRRVHKDKELSSQERAECTVADFMKSLHKELESLSVNALPYE